MIARIVEAKTFWAALHRIHPTLVFVQKSLHAALELLADKQAADGAWTRPLSAVEKADMAARMSKRIRCQSRHINQARAKNAETPWVVSMLGTAAHPAVGEDVDPEGNGTTEGADSPSGGADDDESKVAGAAQEEYFVGRCVERHNAWRQSHASRGHAQREWAQKMDFDEEGDLNAFPDAVFEDGVRHEIKQITVRDLLAKQLARSCMRGPLWKGMSAAGAETRLVRMKDRTPLIALQEKVSKGREPFRMVCMTTISSCGSGRMAEPRCIEIMKEVAVAYTEAVMTKEDIYKLRDEKVQATIVTRSKL